MKSSIWFSGILLFKKLPVPNATSFPFSLKSLDSAINEFPELYFKLPIVGTNHTGDVFDVYHSGKFLITKARHNFDKANNRYKMYLSTVKDSFNQELPDGGSEAQQPVR